MKTVKSRFTDTAIFFGEPEKTADKLKPEVLFNDVWKFAKDIDATRKDKQEKEDREKKRKAAKEKASGKKESPTISAAPKKEVKKEEPKKEPAAVPMLQKAEEAELKSSAAVLAKKGKESGAMVSYFTTMLVQVICSPQQSSWFAQEASPTDLAIEVT